MRISNMCRIIRPVTVALLPLLFLFLLDVRALAQDRPGGRGRLENARWELAGDVVVITYDLIGDADLTYEVSITLTRESDKNLKIVPKTVKGAIGRGKYAGVRMEIRWEYRKDVQQPLTGDDYSFEFVIQIIKEESSSNLLYYLLGGVGVAAGAAALVLAGGKKVSEVPSTLPNPPTDRPPSQ